MEQGVSEAGSGFVGRIPVRNLWLLMLYASDLYRTMGTGSADLEDSPDDLPDLVATILANAVDARRRRSLNPGYRSKAATLSRVRGRIDMLATSRRQLLDRGLVACRFDELTIDTPRNRLVWAALEAVSSQVKQSDLARRCRALAQGLKLAGVSGVMPTRSQLSTDVMGRNDADDRVMVAAARLVFDLALPSEAAGRERLPLPGREEVWARRLFERAVAGFYQVRLSAPDWRVRPGLPLSWPVTLKTAGVDRILPQMRTDVVLDHPVSGTRIVIDTKFNSIVTQGWHRDETLRSAYLYQIYAYLRSQSGNGEAMADSASGLLLHPAIGEDVDESVVIQGHRIRFATVDLAGSSAGIGQALMRLCSLH